MTVFSCLVKGVTENPNFPQKPVHDLTKKNPSSPAATFKEGIIPTVRLSLWVIMQKRPPSTALTTSPLMVIWSFHSGIRSSSSDSTALILSSESRSNGSDISTDAADDSVPMTARDDQTVWIVGILIGIFLFNRGQWIFRGWRVGKACSCREVAGDFVVNRGRSRRRFESLLKLNLSNESGNR